MQPMARPKDMVVSYGQLSTQTGPLSTQAVARIQLRDPDFVTRYSIVSYLTTGVESRTSVECRPLAEVQINTECGLCPNPVRRCT